jgi:hypothetical protein
MGVGTEIPAWLELEEIRRLQWLGESRGSGMGEDEDRVGIIRMEISGSGV